ncbi:hypothetical protein BX616_000568 [Lobosporangium transversale]|uniref:Uncharacterized protein n=1 Tax=Lobosporangium transversale TaxID=64571 RepID=A0A1Y2GDC7_9FUNG|nr:hypothetical protein BCR41DRAFT_424705 [Lobosporangium transversale]KAF9917570.1 hypothetical protein BX616_000568 [Lobosporangium transversale]ORZ07740.1 hypothetical protein BCR41DRAFT_424705 [Lobosporangium transversale]|eukprot:XP_021878106.1 hypothetical protein BCR41DRAFT_424705 [Lobosporangium transversale]
MDKPINGDKYVRTLSHYFRHNQKRLVPVDPDASNDTKGITQGARENKSSSSNHSNSVVGQSVRSIITPADPMAAAYSGMVNSLWSVGSAVVDSLTPSSTQRPPTTAQDRDSYSGAWDGTGTIPADSNPRERQLYLQAQLKAPIFPLDLYYLLYLLDRFELEGIEIEGWEGSVPRAVGDSKPRVLNASNGSTYSSFPPPNASTRPQSIRSFSSTALSTLTLITGWKQWSSAASSNTNNMTISDDVHFIHKFLKKIAGLRLVAKMAPDLDPAGKGKIEGYNAQEILNILAVNPSDDSSSSSSRRQQQQRVLLPLAATFSSLTHLELHKIPPKCVDGWETLMRQLKSLVIIQAGLEDVHDAIVTAVVESERRRRERISKEKNRAVLIRQEQREALKDSTSVTMGRRHGQGSSSGSSSSGPSSPENSQPPSPSLAVDLSGDEAVILNSIEMWPVLRHLSVSDNAIPTLKHNDTFLYAQAIVTLDLSHNLLIAPPHALIHLHNLHYLNLSYNMLSGVQAIYQILGNIAVLDLRGNRLESLCGLERLWNLEKVDVRENNLDEAAEVGRLAALPCIREIWAEMNPFCTIQPKYRLEILAVFKANGHELLLDGSFASFAEKRTLANMSPTSFSSTISSISVVNVANIPAASVPTATLAKELAPPPPRITRPTDATKQETHGNINDDSSTELDTTDKDGLAAASPGINPSSPVKLVKKKLVRSSKRVKRIVNLDSDHDDDSHEEEGEEAEIGEHHDVAEGNAAVAHPKPLDARAASVKKKRSTKKAGASVDAEKTGNESGEGVPKKSRKKSTKKKSSGLVSFAPDSNGNNNGAADLGEDCIDHSECRDNHHVHRLAQLERSLNSIQLNNNNNNHHGNQHQARHNQPSRGILKRSSGVFDPNDPAGMRPSSPNGSMCSSDDGGAEAYRRKIEAMRNEAGSNWLKVLAEMDSENTVPQRDSGM